MSVPSSAERGAKVGHDTEDFLEIEMTDGEGTVAVLHRWQEAAPDRTAAPNLRLRHRLRFARAATDWGVSALALVGSGLFALEASSLLIAAVAAAILPAVIALFGGYRSAEPGDGLAPVAAGLGATAFTVAILDASIGLAPSTTGLLVYASILVVLEAIAFVVWSWILRSPSVRKLSRLQAVVVCLPEADEDLSDVLGSLKDLEPIATVDGYRLGSRAATDADALGAHVDRALDASEAECLLVVDGAVPSRELEDLRRVARLHDAEMRVIVPLPATFPRALHVRAVDGGYAVVQVPRSKITRAALIAKRAMDLIVGGVAFVLALPIMVAIGIAIRLTSPGPALFLQERTTKGGRVFRILKFRTMEAGSDRSLEDHTVPFFKMAEDPRLTRIGRWLRPLSLDELPQLWNVLRGDMSLVGPRPLRTEQVHAHPELLEPRHDVAAGMTGWWQVNGRSDLPAEEAVVLDRFYIENWSFGLDLRILVKTIGVLFKRRGAY